MGIYLAGQEFDGIHIAGTDFSKLFAGGVERYAESTGNEQVIQLPAAIYTSGSVEVNWQFQSGDYLAIIDGLKPDSGDALFFIRIRCLAVRNGEITLTMGLSASNIGVGGQDLSDAFETRGQIELAVGSNVLIVPMSHFSDREEPYVQSSLGQDVIDFVNAVIALTGNQAGTLTLRDYGSPPHTFQITAGQSGSGGNASRGYNVGNFGSIRTGWSASYDTPAGKTVTIRHCRRVGNELLFGLNSVANAVTDFPKRIVVDKLAEGANVRRTFTPQSGSFQAVTGGFRQDYLPESGSPVDVFINNAIVRVDLYY